MPVIRCHSGESFFIGDDIEVVILEGGAHVRVGIHAPRELPVLRTVLIPADELELGGD